MQFRPNRSNQMYYSVGVLCSTLLLVLLPLLACSSGGFLAWGEPTLTPTPTKTSTGEALTEVAEGATDTATPLPPTEPPPATPTDTPQPTATFTPLPPTDTPEPSATPTEPPPTATFTPAPPTTTPQPTATPTPALDFVITELRVMGLGENNGGIEGAGSGRTIFITVVDAAGNPIDGALIINTAEYPRETVSGDKGPGKAEVLMDREVFRLTIASVGGAPVASEVSHNMSLMQPVPTDIVGKLGGPDYSNPACVTLDNCPLPPGKHFSYIITFQRTY